MRMIMALCTLGFLSVALFGAMKDMILARKLSAAPSAIARPAPTAAPSALALPADRSGHFQTFAVIDGRSLRMMIDTGATYCAFSEEDAARAGISVGPADFTRAISTANGVIRVAPVRVGAIQIGAITVRDVEAVVIPRGRLSTNLLGMSFLKRVRDFSISGSTMTLRG